MTAPELKNSSGEILITFEDLHLQGQAMGPLPSGYMGFTWSDSAWFMTKAFSSSVCPGAAGKIGLLNAHGKDIRIESKRLFDLKGLSLCTLWTDKAQVCVEGWEKEAKSTPQHKRCRGSRPSGAPSITATSITWSLRPAAITW
jgi:hypothetical protein